MSEPKRRISWLFSVPAVFEFELRRTRTVPQMAWWSLLACFPVFIVLLALTIPNARTQAPVEFWQIVLFALVPLLISMLGTFRWTTTAVSAELEGQSWVYLAVRPGGRVAVVVGKLLVAIVWVLPAALFGVTLSIAILWIIGSNLATEGAVLRTWLTMVGLTCLAIPTYASLYLALGIIFTKRAMVVGVAYTLVFEFIVSFVPALINKFTVQYRLRTLFLDWADIDTADIARNFVWADVFSSAPAWQNVTILMTYGISLVLFSCWLVRSREYQVTTSADMS